MAKVNLKNIHRLINEATKQVPVADSFVADLKVAIQKKDAAEARLPSKCYKPSSMKCIRNMYFQVTGTEPDVERADSCLVGICESGSDRHERIQSAVSYMKECGIDCEYIDVADYVTEHKLDYLEIKGKQGFETKLYHKDLNISFLCDGIIKYKGKYYILEIKTESLYKWQSRDGVAEEHISQGTCYSICFGINEVIFVYENRDNCDKKGYLLTVTEELKAEVLTKIEECDGYVERLIPPPKPTDLPKKVCAYCNYKSECRKVGK